MEGILKYNKKHEEDFYLLLGCDELSSNDQILCEYKVRSLKCHPDKNIDDADAVCTFQKMLKAKEILTDPEKRAIYDKWRRSGFSMPFEQFLNLSKSAHTSIHWACKKQKDLMIEDSGNDDYCTNPEKECKAMSSSLPTWQRETGSELLRRFRNYEV